jgi:hypothetical protein
MTKRNLLLVGLFLVFGMVAMAPSALAAAAAFTAQVPSVYSWGRTEGKAEAAGPVQIALATGGTVSSGGTFTLTYSAPVVAGSVLVTCTGGTTSPWYSGCGTTLSATTPISISGKVVTIQFGTSNTTFPGGTTDNSTMTVTARVDATGVTPATDVTVKVGGKGLVVNTTSNLNVLYVNAKPSIALQADSYTGDSVATVLSCIGVKEVATYDNEFIINVAESFAQALSTYSQEVIWDSGGGVAGALGTDVTNGSNIVVTFANVPSSVGIAAEAMTPCSTMNTADPLYCLGGSMAWNTPTPTTVAAPSASGLSSFTYTVASMDAGFPESVDLTFKFWSHGPLPVGLPSMTVNIAYGPTASTTKVPNIPYFTGTNEYTTGMIVAEFSDCITNLLFPYVNTFMAGGTAAFANFGTGIDFANTTMDPYGTITTEKAGAAVAQSGNCTIYLYPANTSGVQTFTTANIPSGGSWAFDVASSVPGFAGNTGYAIAICNFQNAYGFAEIYDNYGIGAPTAVLGYNAYILPDPEFYHRNPGGKGLGENAIAPVNVRNLVAWLYWLIEGAPLSNVRK